MYFASRVQAGRMLAARLQEKYRYQNCAVMALNDGGVIVGAQIAMQLHCVLTLLESAVVNLPREPVPVAGITSSGTVSYNKEYSQGELDEILSENFGYIEQEKLKKIHELNTMVGGMGTINKDLLKGHNVIVVSDGLKNGFQVDLAYEFLKPIAIDKLIFAVPFANVDAVDHMHVLGDELYCLNVLEDYRETDHYYNKNDIPDHKLILKTIEQIILHWK